MDKLYKYKDVVQMLVDVIEQAEENEGIEIVDRPMGWESIRDYAEEVVSDIPSAEKQGEWIPCSERLPSEDEDVMAWVESGDEARIACCNYAKEVWFDAIMDVEVSPIAWMPLPKPWEGADGESI